MEDLAKWPLEYMLETKECICGWCGQVLIGNHTTDDPETHFQSCTKSKETGLLMGFKDLLKVNQKLEGLNVDIRTNFDKMKAEVMAEVKAELLKLKTEFGAESEFTITEFNKKFVDLKSDVKKDLETEIANRETSEAVLLNKVNALEEGTEKTMREMGVDHEMKMAEVNGRVSGVTETVSTVIYSMVEVKGKEVTSSADTNESEQSKKEIESLRMRLKKSEGEIGSIKTQLEAEVTQLKTGTETVSKQLKTNNRDLQVLKRKMEDEGSNQLVKKKKKSYHMEPSPFDQLTIPMNTYNLVTQTYLFQPSFRWTIDGIKNILEQKTFETTSAMFQWNGYPIQARAKLQIKEDNCIYMSLCLKGVSNDESELKNLTPIPYVFYLLKSKYARNPRHICRSHNYLSESPFKYPLTFNLNFGPKTWLDLSTYKVDDSAEIEIYAEPSPMTQQAHSYDGTLEWSMENYARRLQLEKEGLIINQESPYFYTSPRGYRVQMTLHLNGIKGLGPTASILFWTGKFDAELPNSFAHSTTVTLINRKKPERSIAKTTAYNINNKKGYLFEICKVEEMETLVENDTLFCKVSITAQKTTN